MSERGIPYGLIERHGKCSVYVGWAEHEEWPGAEIWSLQSLNPLTLEEAIVCPECGTTGYIIDGRWEA